MTDKIIPIADQRRTMPLPAEGESSRPGRTDQGILQDTLGRPVRDLRISVTDRCNFRCVYCMPRDVFGPDYAFLSRGELLTFEEIARVARIARPLGDEKVRLTGAPAASRCCAGTWST
jgi:cyclic pyranopterin phosphate synthase